MDAISGCFILNRYEKSGSAVEHSRLLVMLSGFGLAVNLLHVSDEIEHLV